MDIVRGGGPVYRIVFAKRGIYGLKSAYSKTSAKEGTVERGADNSIAYVRPELIPDAISSKGHFG
jgi:hypothetical protein